MPVGYDRDGAVASLYQVGGCPTFAYVYPGGTLQSASIGDLTAAAAGRPRRAAAGRHAGGGRGLMELRRRRAADGLGPGPPAGLGGAPPRRRVPRPRDRLGRGRRPPRPQPRAGPRAACAISPTASTAPTRSTCANGRSPGPTASSSARSGSTPTAPGPRSSSSPSIASTTAPSRAEGLPADALTIAIVETGVALRAFDADRLEGGLCIRDSAPGESLPGRPGELAQGTLAIADEQRPGRRSCSGPPAEGYEVEPESRRLAIVAIQVNGRAADRRRRGALDGRGDARGRRPLSRALTDFWLAAPGW